MKISMKLPYIMHFDDYHEISGFADRVNELTGSRPKLKFTEINSEWGYAALFYVGKQDKKYKALLKKHKDALREGYDDEIGF